MADFTIEIAGHTAAVHSLFDSTKDYCRAYWSEKMPEFSISITQEDLRYEQRMADEEAVEEGFRFRVFTDPFLDRAAIQRKLADHLLPQGVLMLHGSAIAVDGKGYLFTAKSGTGKSTHTRLWREAFGSRAVMINDDKPFLRQHLQRFSDRDALYAVEIAQLAFIGQLLARRKLTGCDLHLQIQIYFPIQRNKRFFRHSIQLTLLIFAKSADKTEGATIAICNFSLSKVV